MKIFPKSCWIISDNTKGMLNQSIALANALGLDYQHFLALPTPLLRLFPTLAKIPGWQLTLGRKPDWLKINFYPDFLITSGKRMAGISIGIKRLSRGKTKTIHIQDPNVCSSNFDFLILPEHDYYSKKRKDLYKSNVYFIKGSLNYLTQKIIHQSYKNLEKHCFIIKKPILAVILGGNNKRYKLKNIDFTILSKKLINISKKLNLSILVVPSRRTPKFGMQTLEEEFNSNLIKNNFFIFNYKHQNPYPGILKLADAILVSSDSINMQTEVCITGKPIFLLKFREEKGKIAYFNNFLIKNNYVKNFDDLISNPKLLNSKFKKLDEIKKIAKITKSFFDM